MAAMRISGEGIAVDSFRQCLRNRIHFLVRFSHGQRIPGGEPGSTNAFVTKVNPGGNGLTYSTYLGSGNFDYGICHCRQLRR